MKVKTGVQVETQINISLTQDEFIGLVQALERPHRTTKDQVLLFDLSASIRTAVPGEWNRSAGPARTYEPKREKPAE